MQDMPPADRHRRSPSKVMSPRFVGSLHGQAVPFGNAFNSNDKARCPLVRSTKVLQLLFCP